MKERKKVITNMDEVVGSDVEKIKIYTEHLRKDIMRSRVMFSIPTMVLKMISGNNKLRMSMLEFVDVLPSLGSSDEIYEHFNLIAGPECKKLPGLLGKCVGLFSKPVLKQIGTKGMSLVTYKSLAPYFIVNKSRLAPTLKKHQLLGMQSNLDFVGEAVISEKEAEKYMNRYLSAIPEYGKSGNLSVSIKPSSLYSMFGPENYKESKRVVVDRLTKIFRVAKETNTAVAIDSEQNYFCQLIEDIFCAMIMMPEFRDMKNVGIALQTYRKNSMDSAKSFVEIAKQRGVPFFIRLVKGAYWDSEVAWSQQKSWEMPLFEKKEETDKHFVDVARYLFDNWHTVYVSPATHNPESIANMILLTLRAGVRFSNLLKFEALYGLGDPICAALKQNKCNIVVYIPVGNMKEGMSYMARRILENTSNDGFLIELLK